LAIRPVVSNSDLMVFVLCIEKYLTFGEVENLGEDVVVVVVAVAVVVWLLPVPVKLFLRFLVLRTKIVINFFVIKKTC
jgi:hypothetical protein